MYYLRYVTVFPVRYLLQHSAQYKLSSSREGRLSSLLYLHRVWGLFGKVVKCPECKAKHSLILEKIKDAWSYASTHSKFSSLGA